MSDFKAIVEADIESIFLDTDYFGELRTIRYDGEQYKDRKVVLSQNDQKARSRSADDYGEGLYDFGWTMHIALSALNGVRPEQHTRIQVSQDDGFYKDFYILTSSLDEGMVTLTLQDVNE